MLKLRVRFNSMNQNFWAQIRELNSKINKNMPLYYKVHYVVEKQASTNIWMIKKNKISFKKWCLLAGGNYC